MKTSLKLAYIAGIAPLVIGTAIFILWLWHRTPLLMMSGIVMIWAGVCSVVIGAICLAVYLWGVWRSATIPRGRLALQTAAVLGLFLLNFLVAASFVIQAIALETRTTFSIANLRNEPLHAVCVHTADTTIDFGDIPANTTVKRSFTVNSFTEGGFSLTATQNGEKINVPPFGYVTRGVGGDNKITFSPSGEVITEVK